MAASDWCELSPIKLGPNPKRVRRSLDHRRCVICQQSSTDSLKTLTNLGVASLVEAAHLRQDIVYTLLVDEYHELSKVPTNIDFLYHRNCLYSYISKQNLQYVKQEEQDQEALTGPTEGVDYDSIQRRSTIPSVDWLKCIVCQKTYHKKDKRVCKIETFERSEHLLQAARNRTDAQMLHRISDEDLIAKETVYHPNCLATYLSKTNIKILPDQRTTDAASTSPHKLAFDKLIADIHDDIIKHGKAFLLSKLLEKYKSFLPTTADANFYTGAKLQNKIQKHYGDDVTILSQLWEGQGQSNIVISSKITLGDAVKAANDLKFEMYETRETFSLQDNVCSEDTLLHNAAAVLREDIAAMQTKDDFPSTDELSLEASLKILPPRLVKLIMWIINNNAFQSADASAIDETSDDILRRCISISECVVFSSGQHQTPQHVGLAVQLHNTYGSRALIDLLHSYGFCISYDELRRLETSMAQHEINKMQELDSVYVPNGLVPLENGGMFVHEGDDNIDINSETTDGKNTFHAMARVVFQQQQTTQERTFPAIKRDSVKSLPLEPDIEKLMQCKSFAKPSKRAEPTGYENPLDRIATCRLKMEVSERDLLWILLRMLPREVLPLPTESVYPEKQIIPFWTGFNTRLSEKKEIFTAAVYAPVINAKPTDMATVYTSMSACKDMSHQIGQTYSVQTMDLQLFAIAMQIKWHSKEEFATHTIRLGGFHALSAFIGSIGKLWGDGGLRDLLVDSNVYAGATVDNMLLGKQFNRAVRGIMLAYEALFHLLITTFLKWCEDEKRRVSEEVWSKLMSMYTSMQENDQPRNLKEAEVTEAFLMHEVLPLLTEFRKVGCEHSSTFKYWNMFLDAAEILFLDVRAAREGNWKLHLHTASSMIPYFFSANKTNYARWMPVYILEMLHAPKEVVSLFEEGQFSIYQIAGSFNGIWSDMGTEKTIIRHAKGDGGIVGLTRKQASLMRWMLTRHIMAQYTDVMEKRSGLTQTQHKGHQQTQPASMKRDEDDVIQLKNHLLECMTNPFDMNADMNPEVLVNISSGLHASQEIKKTLLDAVSSGQLKMEKFVETTLSTESQKSFYHPISKSSVKTFSSMKVTTPVQKGIKTGNVNISPEMIFRRALSITSYRDDVTLETVMSNPITAVPTSLFHEDGSMRKTTKSDLSRKLEELTEQHTELPGFTGNGPTTYIRDSMAIIQMMPGNNYTSFDHLAAAYLQGMLTSFQTTGADTVVDVFDQYDVENSVKAGERANRTQTAGSTKEYTVQGNRSVPTWKKFLAVGRNKKKLTEFLCHYVSQHAPHKLTRGRQLILAGGFEEGGVTKVITSQGAENMPSLFCSQEEADTRMIFHAGEVNVYNAALGVHGRVVIRSADTDVLVLTIHYLPQWEHVSELWIETGHTLDYRNSHRFIPVHELCKTLSLTFTQILPAVHALTGCDSTSALYGIGKKSAMKLLESKGAECFDKLKMMSQSEESQSEEKTAVQAASEFVILLYDGSTTEVSLNKFRYKLAKKRDASLARLPPCEATFKEHAKRAMWQTRVWTSAHVAFPNLGSPLDFGWKKVGSNIIPEFFKGLTAAELLKDMVCICRGKRRCSSGCLCSQSGLPCTDVCACQGNTELCGNVITGRKAASQTDTDDEEEAVEI